MTLLKGAGVASFVFGAVLAAIGLVRYFAYAPNDDRSYAIVLGTVQHVNQDSDEVRITVSYEYNGRVFSKTESSTSFRDLGFKEGQELELWVNVQQPEEVLLPVLKPLVQSWGLRYIGMGLFLILVSVVLWRIGRPS